MVPTPQILSTLDIAQFFLDTTKQALIDCSRKEISRAYVAAGQVVWDDCCGLLVVAPERVFRSETFPQEAGGIEICFGGHVAVSLVVLLVRCLPSSGPQGQAPSADDLQTAYAEVLEDAAVVYNAVVGPLPEGWSRANATQVFVGAEGGCVGVETRLIIGIEQDRFAICNPC